MSESPPRPDPRDPTGREADPAPSPAAAGKGHALWGGRFTSPMAPEMAALNLSLDVDRRLWREDLRGSRAWARALAGAGVVTEPEADRLVDGLHRVEARLERDGFEGAPDEDIHSLVERLLFEEVGEVAGKLHTGRSRNDQAATDFRLWGRGAAAGLDASVEALARALLGLARRSMDVIMPGYTHLQQAQPIRASHWALSHVQAFARDRDRIRDAAGRASALPLGTGALAGCPFPVDREALAAALGFERVSENSVDTAGDRDWVAELTWAGAMTGVHVSRLGEDLVLFTSVEFGFLRLDDAYSTGSSLMPQKRNPDVAELARGKAGRLVGNLTAVLTLLKGLPTGYNRDLQEDKHALFDTVDTLALTLPALTGAVATASFREARVRAALDPQLLATDLADHLVRRGVPFRTSHEVIGRLVRRAEEEGVRLDVLPDAAFADAHPAFGPDVREVFDWTRSVDARAVTGGTGREAVEEQLARAARRLDEQSAWREGTG